MDWAFLQRHTFEADVWQCPCGGRRRLLAVVTRRATAEEVLRNLGWGSARPPRATGHSPPQAPGALTDRAATRSGLELGTGRPPLARRSAKAGVPGEFRLPPRDDLRSWAYPSVALRPGRPDCSSFKLTAVAVLALGGEGSAHDAHSGYPCGGVHHSCR